MIVSQEGFAGQLRNMSNGEVDLISVGDIGDTRNAAENILSSALYVLQVNTASFSR